MLTDAENGSGLSHFSPKAGLRQDAGGCIRIDPRYRTGQFICCDMVSISHFLVEFLDHFFDLSSYIHVTQDLKMA